jgi:pantoate--beta-alanine ligase
VTDVLRRSRPDGDPAPQLRRPEPVRPVLVPPEPVRPVLVRTRSELAAVRAALPGPVAAVLTMGALHDGHAALMRAARARAQTVAVTVFVNPLQFSDPADLARYPRQLDADLRVCEREGVDLVFAPDEREVYPGGAPQIRVTAPTLGSVLEGAHRPGHFDGVLTVVVKLLQQLRPDVALFGEKDAQQLALIRRLVRELDLPVRIVGVPTVREPDGLARSSRNALLSPVERARAAALSRALAAGAARAADGPEAVRRAAADVLERAPGVAVDYLALTDPELGELPPGYAGPALLLLAARVGATRLIDNMQLELGRP